MDNLKKIEQKNKSLKERIQKLKKENAELKDTIEKIKDLVFTPANCWNCGEGTDCVLKTKFGKKPKFLCVICGG